SDRGVTFGFTSIILAPAAEAAIGSEAAGCTILDVPTTNATSAERTASKALSIACCGNISPNNTISGRMKPGWHLVHDGGSTSSNWSSTGLAANCSWAAV